MPRIQVVVSDEQKTRWSDYAEDDPRFDSMSELVRRTVESEIATETQQGAGVGDDMDEIIAGIDSLESDLGSIDTELKALRTENLQEDDLEGFIHSDFAPVIEKVVEQAVREAMWDWTDNAVIRPNMRNIELVRNRLVDMSKDEIIDYIEETE